MNSGKRTPSTIRIGLTGGFGTGKSTVAKMFHKLGAYVVDADELARNSLKKGRKEYREVVSVFGDHILSQDGQIDRKALADEVFPDYEKLSQLNRIIHPGVIREIRTGLENAREKVRIAVIPLLFETGLEPGFDFLIVVAADQNTVLQRVSESRNMNEREIVLRSLAQIPLDEKIKQADFVIDNGETIEKTREQVESIWGELAGK